MKKITVILLLLVGLMACGKKPILTLDTNKITLLVGEVKEVGYEVSGNHQVILTPADNDIIAVEGDFITALSKGETTLTLSIKGSNVKRDILIEVKEKQTTKIERLVLLGKTSLVVGEEMMLNTKVSPSGATHGSLTYQSSDTSIATVNNDGMVVALKAGEVTISVSVDGLSATLKVNIVEQVTQDYVDFYYLNDLHGAIERQNSNLGLAYIANFLEQRRKENPNLVFLAGGDMLQGSALSNYYKGESTLTLLKLMGLDAMTLGNHEFDWGLEEVTKHFDPSNNPPFPLLGINVIEKATQQRPKNVAPHVLLEKGNLKIGVIGAMGEGLEGSIAFERIKDYQFIESLMLIKEAASQLRSSGADVVVVVIHAYDTALNNAIAQLVGDEKIDAIFNAHAHMLSIDELYGKPLIQSRHNGDYIGHIRIYLNGTHTVENINRHTDLNTPSSNVLNQIEIYKEETDEIFYTKIIQNKPELVDRSELSLWLTKLIRAKTGADIAFHNYGGTRTEIQASEDIHLAKLYAIWPFDNVIKTVHLSGSMVIELINNGSLVYNTDVTINPSETYVVATNDYIFDHADNQYIFSTGSNHTNTGILLRDLVEGELTLQSGMYPYFDPSNPIQTIVTFKEVYQFLYL